MRTEIGSTRKPLCEFLRQIPMDVEMLTDLLNTYLFFRSLACPEYKFCETGCDKTQLDAPIDAFASFQAIRVKPEVLFCVSEGRVSICIFDDSIRRSWVSQASSLL